MHIGYLVPEFPSQTHAFFWRELCALRELGHAVTLLSTRRPPRDACLHDFAERGRAETRYLFPPRYPQALRQLARHPARLVAVGQHLAACERKRPSDAARQAGLALCAADLVAHARTNRLDHIHVHSCADAAQLAAMCRLLGGPPYSLTLHGDLPVYGSDHAQKMRPAAFVSAVTRQLRDQIVTNVGLPESRVPVIWMGVDTERFRPQPRGESSARASLELVTVARLNHTKGHRFALAAVRQVRDEGLDVRYTIAGAGPEQPAIEAEIQRLGLGASVTLAGTISEADVLGLLERSDGFVLPSVGLGEAAPVSVMEAMACGLPVICSIIGGTADMISTGVDGILVDQEDVSGLARAMARLARDPAFRAQLGRKARERALASFDYRVNAQLLALAIERSTHE
jgi:colanic acid/amylovoran biosynthesis glycosyltransferase